MISRLYGDYMRAQRGVGRNLGEDRCMNVLSDPLPHLSSIFMCLLISFLSTIVGIR